LRPHWRVWTPRWRRSGSTRPAPPCLPAWAAPSPRPTMDHVLSLHRRAAHDSRRACVSQPLRAQPLRVCRARLMDCSRARSVPRPPLALPVTPPTPSAPLAVLTHLLLCRLQGRQRKGRAVLGHQRTGYVVVGRRAMRRCEWHGTCTLPAMPAVMVPVAEAHLRVHSRPRSQLSRPCRQTRCRWGCPWRRRPSPPLTSSRRQCHRHRQLRTV